jgi:hypothetical protein
MPATYEIKVEKNCIGAWVAVVHQDSLHVGTVLDLVAGTNTPKRIRIQRGPLQGDVVQPHEYQFKAFLKDEEIDP